MNHPTPEEWGLYLYGEGTPELNRRLKSHLSECDACAAEVGAMQGTMGKLDTWKLARSPSRAGALEPVMKFAMAALIVLGLGVGVGRLTTSGAANMEGLRAEIAGDLLGEVQAAENRLGQELRTLLAASEARLAGQTKLALQALGRDLLQTVNEGREQDRRAVQGVLERFRQDREVDYVSLRRDLETLAAAADQQLQQARLNLLHLAANSNVKD